jgi:glutamyl-tRNA reductase
MNRLVLLGLNHTTAPLEVRERLAFSPRQRRDAVAGFRRRFDSAEVVLLSTCNRVELYVARAVHGHPRADEMSRFLGELHGVEPEQFGGHVYERAERSAVEHLFSVATSLDSMVPGETQILGQVREAYESAAGLGATGALLNPLFQRAIAVGKQVLNETSLAEGRLSVASVAVDHARRIFDHFDDKTVLCIGAGKMAALALRGFAALKPQRLMVCNRDSARAAELARQFGADGVGFEAMEDHVVAADIVITSTGSADPLLTRSRFESILKRRRYRPIFVIDIAVPRDVEAAVGELDHVYLYNLDDLQQVVGRTLAQRTGAIESARQIVARHVDQFVLWNRQRELGPAIDRLYRKFHDMAREELDRTLCKRPNVSSDERAHLEELSRRIVNKLLHDPLHQLRHADTLHGPSSQYLHALERLFRLDSDDKGTSA